jgi:Trk K+ transport system NAD-binding subunit
MKEKRKVIILGVNNRIETLLGLLKEQDYRILVISEQVKSFDKELEGIETIESDFLERKVLLDAGIEESFAVIILAESIGYTAKDTDARSVVATLSVESINPAVKTVVEVLSSDTAFHLRNANVDEIIQSGSLTGDILAFSTNHPHFSQHLGILLRYAHKNKIVTSPVTERYVGKSLSQIVPLMAANRKILLGIRPKKEKDEETLDPEHIASDGEEFIYIDML